MKYFTEQILPILDEIEFNDTEHESESMWTISVNYNEYAVGIYATEQEAEKKPLAIQIDLSKATVYGEPMKLTPDDLLREALKDDPIAEMVELITQRHEIQQSINTLLPRMTKDEVTEVYHTLYRIEQKVNEREEQ